MDKVWKQWSRIKNKSEAAQDSGDEVFLQSPRPSPDLGKSPKRSKKKNSSSESSPLTSQSSVATTTFVESEGKSSTSPKGYDVFQLDAYAEHHFGQNPPHKSKANTWGGSKNAEGSLSPSSGSSLLGSSPVGSGVQKPERRLASNSKEDQAKRQAYRPVSQRKALQDEFEQVKKERDEAKQELADEKDRNVKLEQDHRKNRKKLSEVSKDYSELRREVFDMRLKIQQCKCGKTPQESLDKCLPECDEGVNYHSLPESNAGEGSAEVGQQYRSYQSFGSSPDSSRVDTLMKLHLEEKLKKKDLEIVQLNQTNCDLEQKLKICEESTCDLARPRESDILESLREQVKTMESAAQQKEETIVQLTKECTELKEELEQQETDHDLQVLTAQEDLAQALKTNEALNLEEQQLRTSQSEQVELRLKLMKQHASDLDVKKQEIDALKKEKGTLMSKERKWSISNVLHGEFEGRSADELMAEKQERIDSLEGEKKVLVENAQSESSDSQRKLQKEMEEKEKALISLQKQLKDLQMKHVAQVSMLEESLFALQKEKEEVETNDKDFGEEIAKMNKQIEDLWKQIESLQAEKRTLKSEKQSFLDSLSRERESEKRQAEQLQTLKGKLREKETAEAEGKQVLIKKEREIQSLQVEKRTLESEKQKLLSEQRESEKRQADELEFLEGKLREKETVKAEGKQVIDNICTDNEKKEKQIQSLQAQVSTWPVQIAIVKETANKENMKLSKELNTAKKELDAAREELGASKVEIDARIQHEVKITRELRASNEEKSRLQDQLQAVQFQLEAYKADFDQERKDRASAAGRYVEEEEQLKKALKDLSAKLGKKALEVDELKEKLEREQVQRVAEAANHSDQAKAYQRTIREVQIARDETEAKLVQLREVSVSNKKEAEIFKNKFEHLKQREQQLRAQIEQLQKDNAKLSHDIANKNDKWFLKSNRKLSQLDDHGRLGGHRGGRHGDRHGGGHGKQDEDSEMTMAALMSEKTFWEEQCKQLKEDFEYEREHFRQLEQQLREENHKLKQEKAHMVKGAQTGVYREAHGRYGDQHGGEDDVDMIVATLRSENSHLEEQNKQLKKDYERTVEELKEEIRRLQQQQQPTWTQIISIESARAVGEQVSETKSMANAVAPRERLADSEWKQQTRMDQFEGKLGEFERILSELRQHPQEHIHYNISPHRGDAYRHNASDKMTRSSSDSSLEQSMSNLPHPLSKVRPVLRPTISPVPTKSYSRYWYAENMYGETTNGREVDGPTLPHNRDADRDGITQEIREKAEELKKPPKGLSVADDVDEKLWPYDPNLVCPHCGKRFRHGQIREFRFHIDDEHSPSLM